MHSTRRDVCLFVSIALLGMPAMAAGNFDIVISNARILDGTGSPYRNADIGIVDDIIVSIGDLEKADANRVIDAKGLYVAPGFIDMHSHADRGLVSDSVAIRAATNLVTQGITTVVVGADGRNVRWPITKEIEAYEERGVGLNVVPMVGHGEVRKQVMGDDYERPATASELVEMRKIVREGMRAGAWGMGVGLEYRPGRFSNTDELVELAKVVGEFDGFYCAHQRSQSPLPRWQLPSQLSEEWRVTGTEGTLETIEVGRRSGIRVVGTHIKAKGPLSWGHSATDVQLIDDARQDGVQIYLDQYPYETFGGSATTVIPKWVYTPASPESFDGDDDPDLDDASLYENYKDNIRRHLADSVTRAAAYRDIEYKLVLQGGADRHIIVESSRDPALVGQSLSEVAAENGNSAADQLIEFALSGTDELRSGVRFRPIAGSNFDVENYMMQEYTATSTDAKIVTETRLGDSPRLFGSFPYKLAHYARDKGTITLAFAVRSSTGLPAQIVGLVDRGLILPGFKADLVVFSLEDLADNSTIQDPGQPSSGIEYVITNGEFTVDRSSPTGKLPGRVLLKRHQD